MVYFETGVKLSDPTFVKIKEILKTAQRQMDTEKEVLHERIAHEDPNFRNDEPRRRLIHNTVRIRKQALEEVAEIAATSAANTKDVA